MQQKLNKTLRFIKEKVGIYELVEQKNRRYYFFFILILIIGNFGPNYRD